MVIVMTMTEKIWNVGSLGLFVETKDGEYKHFRMAFVSKDCVAFEDNIGEIIYITDNSPHMMKELEKIDSNCIILSTEVVSIAPSLF